MNVLLLAPEPFYEERGTPIAIDRLIRVLSERGHKIDVVTYHEGRNVEYDGVELHRIPCPWFLRNIRPGFSWKKLICDAFLLLKAIRLCTRRRYQLVHAVEESVYIAMLIKALRRVPYVYDMDSSLSQQMIERYPVLSPFAFVLDSLEGVAVRNAKVVVAVCDQLAAAVEKHRPKRVVILHDSPMLNGPCRVQEDLRAQLGTGGVLLMYVGNLEPYQGIDLLLESFALALEESDRLHLVVIGGMVSDIRRYQMAAKRLGIDQRAHFLGPRPLEHLAAYLAQADILVSPRVEGNNTPMKIFAYLASGKPLLATNLPTHTQAISSDVALLVHPSPSAFAEGILRLAQDELLRRELAAAGEKWVGERFSDALFVERATRLFEDLMADSGRGQGERGGLSEGSGSDVGVDVALGAMRGQGNRRPEPPLVARHYGDSGASKGTANAVIVATSWMPNGARNGATRRGPRIDYVELAAMLGTDYVDYGAIWCHRAARWVESKLRLDIQQALYVRRSVRERHLAVVASMSERVGIPLSLMLDPRVRHIVRICHPLSPHKLSFLRLSGLAHRWVKLIVYTQAEADALQQLLDLDGERLMVLPDPVDTSFFAPKPKAAQSKEQDYVLSVGLTRRDYPTLLRALGQLPHVRCEIRAGSTWETRGAHFGTGAMPHNVEILPAIGHEALRERYRDAQFVIIPLRRTTQWGVGGTAVAEAQAMGKAVVATRNPGMCEYLSDGETGILVEPDDERSMAEAIDYLWRNPEIAAAMGIRGRQRVESRHGFDTWLRRMANLITDYY
ncbi:MAG: glycosyltransferase [Chloroflexota bacterium]